jgi:hypothetical protein
VRQTLLLLLQVAQGLRQTWQFVLLFDKAKFPRQEEQVFAEEHCRQLGMLQITHAPWTKLYPVWQIMQMLVISQVKQLETVQLTQASPLVEIL